MARLPLLGGAYAARSIIANAQKCINLFPERNPRDAPVPLTHYQRPGLRQLATGLDALPVRGLYRASNGNGYCVIGSKVYSISATWVLTQLGVLTIANSTPVSMIDNGTTLWLVDNSQFGYTIDLATNAFAQIVDPTGTFMGATRVDYIDTFMLWNVLGTKDFGATHSNSIVFDPLYIAGKTDYPDPLVTLIVNRHEILLLGQLKSEIWYDAGNPLFPFAELPGAYIEHGCVAPFSVAATDISVFWLGMDLQGQGLVFRQRGYETKLVSNHAIAYAIRKMANAGTIADAVGYCYQQDGHVFYVLIFPSGDQTWVFDDSIGEPTEAWHQRAWTDSDGVLHRDRTNCHAFLNGTNVVGDWQNGTLYALDLDTYTDAVGVATPGPISFIRTFPHIGAAVAPNGQPIMADGKRVQFTQFLADLECGDGPLDSTGAPPQIGLRWSDDRGKTFGQTVLQSAGDPTLPGRYLTEPQWRGLGIARDRIFELSYSIAGPAALNGGWVEAKVLNT